MLQDLTKELRAFANRIDECAEQLRMPQSGYSLRSAHDRLAAFLPEFNIDMKVWRFKHNGRTEVTWSVYDGKKSYEAPTLTEVVNAVCLAHSARKGLEAAEEILEEAAMPI